MSVFIIAEVGINHNGDINIAKNMILKAKHCGADCVKFQTFKAEEFISDTEQVYTYKSQGQEITESMLGMFKRYEFTPEEWKEIVLFCKENQIEFCSTAQNHSDLKFLLSIADLPFIKVGSDDLTNLEMLQEYASHGKKMLISAGMAYASEIEDAVEAIRREGNNNITILHCVSSYPASAAEVNLKKIQSIRSCFDVDVGYSDHTIGSAAAIGAVCFGATIIEKHFTLDNNMQGPDHWFSANSNELKSFISDIRNIELSIGESKLVPTQKEMEMRKVARRKIIVVENVPCGHVVTIDDITFKRSEKIGLDPKYSQFLLKRTLKKAKNKNDTLVLEDFEEC